MLAADQSGKLFVGDAVLQVGTSVLDLFAPGLIWVKAESWSLLQTIFNPLLFLTQCNVIAGTGI